MDESIFYGIEGRLSTVIKIKRSTFICTMEYVESIEAAKRFIKGVTKENKTASHNCWAYILGEKGEVFHSSDAGEPSGTAGKPMLHTLQRHNLTHVAAVVTRHFGGVKLGVRGLIEAYSASVEETIASGKLKKRIQTVSFSIEVPYADNDTLLNRLKEYLTDIRETVYTDNVFHTIEIEQEDYERVERLLSAYQSTGKLTYTVLSI